MIHAFVTINALTAEVQHRLENAIPKLEAPVIGLTHQARHANHEQIHSNGNEREETVQHDGLRTHDEEES